MSLSKKIFITSLSLFAIFLILWGVYNLSFKKPAIKDIVNPAQTDSKPLTETESKDLKLFAISDEPVISPAINSDGDGIQYYSTINGKVFRMDFDGKNKNIISEQELVGLSNVFWSPDKTKAITHFSSNGKNRFYFYDHSAQKGTLLKNNLDSVYWQSNNKILYKYFDSLSNERTLNLANPDGSNWNKITDLEFKHIRIAPIPKTGLVSFWNKPDAYMETKMQTVPIIGGEKKTIFNEKFGSDFLWNGSGTKLLISHSNVKGGNKMQLAVTNEKGGEYKNIEIPTMVSKCAWSKDNETIYYALPGSIPENSILPNDYMEGKFNTADTFWKVNAKTGEKTRLIDLDKIETKIDATDIFLNSDESLLFFTNRIDGKLYRIDL